MTTPELGRIGIWTGALDALPSVRRRRRWRSSTSSATAPLWFGEAYGREAFTAGVALPRRRQRMVVATGIASIYGRDAVAAATPPRGPLGAAFARPLRAGPRRQPPAAGRADAGPRLRQARCRRCASTSTPWTRRPTSSARPAEPAPRVLAALGPKMLALAARPDRRAPTPTWSRPTHTASAARAARRRPAAGRRAGGGARDRRRGRLPPSGPRAPEIYTGLPNYRNSWLRQGFDETTSCAAAAPGCKDALVCQRARRPRWPGCRSTSTPARRTCACRCWAPTRSPCRGPTGASWRPRCCERPRVKDAHELEQRYRELEQRREVPLETRCGAGSSGCCWRWCCRCCSPAITAAVDLRRCRPGRDGPGVGGGDGVRRLRPPPPAVGAGARRYRRAAVEGCQALRARSVQARTRVPGPACAPGCSRTRTPGGGPGGRQPTAGRHHVAGAAAALGRPLAGRARRRGLPAEVWAAACRPRPRAGRCGGTPRTGRGRGRARRTAGGPGAPGTAARGARSRARPPARPAPAAPSTCGAPAGHCASHHARCATAASRSGPVRGSARSVATRSRACCRTASGSTRHPRGCARHHVRRTGSPCRWRSRPGRRGVRGSGPGSALGP